LLTYNPDGPPSSNTTDCTAWPRYVLSFAITVSNSDAALVIVPESILFREGQGTPHEALITGLEQYAIFVEDLNVAKAVDETLHAEKEGIDCARLSNTLLQIAVNNSFTVQL
jgi:hypothetical protein